MGKQGGILQAWFKNFTILVFTQTFHAIFLSFIISITLGVTISPIKIIITIVAISSIKVKPFLFILSPTIEIIAFFSKKNNSI